MSIQEQDRQTVEGVFRAMQQGPEGEALMVSLFSEDAHYIEPFSGEIKTHRGLAEIRTCFLESVSHGPPDLTLSLDRLDKEGENLRADWTCTSVAFPTPMKGYDLFTIREGKIHRLEIVVTDMPDFGEEHA